MCQVDFTYSMTVKAIKIEDTGKGVKSVAEDLEAVLRKIEDGTKAQSPVIRSHTGMLTASGTA
jgi:hypothetical protein